jgi:ketosteroid isomerase-like protein
MAPIAERVVRGIYEAWAAGDFRAGLEDLDPHVTFVVRPPFPESTVLVGAEAISNYMLGFLDQFEPGSLTVSATRIRSFGDTVLVDVTQRGTGRSSGLELDIPFFMLSTLRGDKIVRMESILDEAEALVTVEPDRSATG